MEFIKEYHSLIAAIISVTAAIISLVAMKKTISNSTGNIKNRGDNNLNNTGDFRGRK
ncbi:hypothetical protein [Psychrobacillus sp.]|uniref:hypothetical protein n=1 Tax=Psychrobacillus sp. TaxID=1871623 RepID=UPI0028BDD03B|nr:hypothetical protein [Psychrobacillus sp.]